jgi:sugar O-acyltransferase (sialic acid O-acetyltransferase NeuD family)
MTKGADMKELIILGTGGNAVDILDTVRDINASRGTNTYKCLGFLDDNPQKQGQSINGIRVLGPLRSADQYRDCLFVNGIGNSRNFWKKPAILSQTGIPVERFATIVHPTASVSTMAKLGRGTVVFQNAVITSNAAIGDHVIILPNSIISHDAIIGDYTCIAGGACLSGGVQVGTACYIGSNSCIIENVVIGNECMVGMGSVVLKDVPANSTVVGNPARFLKNTIDRSTLV